MVTPNMQPDGWGDLAKNLDKFADTRFAPIVREGMTDAANAIKDEVERKSPRTMRKVFGRWPIKVTIDRLHAIPEWVIVVVTNPLAHLIEHGTGIHGPENRRIEASPRAGRLRRAIRVRGGGSDRPAVMKLFVGGRTIFRSSVAGMRKRPFFSPALSAVQPKVRAVLDNMVKEVARKWNRR